MEEHAVRINKYLADAGICSRREADRMIEGGRVRIDGVRAVLGDVVAPVPPCWWTARRCARAAKRCISR